MGSVSWITPYTPSVWPSVAVFVCFGETTEVCGYRLELGACHLSGVQHHLSSQCGGTNLGKHGQG